MKSISRKVWIHISTTEKILGNKAYHFEKHAEAQFLLQIRNFIQAYFEKNSVKHRIGHHPIPKC